MSSNPSPESVTPVTPAAPSAPLKLNADIAAAIAGSGPAVREQVVSSLRSKEVDRRATAVLGGIDLFNQLTGQLKKLDRPDVKPLLGRDGKAIGEGSFTEARLKEIKTLTEKVGKVTKALDAALRDENPDYSPLFNLKGEIDKAGAAEAPAAAE